MLDYSHEQNEILDLLLDTAINATKATFSNPNLYVYHPITKFTIAVRMEQHAFTMQLPVIDISSFIDPNTPQASRIQCANNLATACTTTGFFYVIGHGIPTTMTENILALARRFFLEASDLDKARIARRNPPEGDGARGYQYLGENVTQGKRDYHEAIDFYREWDDENLAAASDLLKGRNIWPEQPTELKSAFLEYVERMKVIGTAVVRAMGSALGLEDEEFFVKQTRKSFWVMRMIGYPALGPLSHSNDDDMDRFSCGEHTDYGCLTLLLADETPDALQVHPSGSKEGTWITANQLPGSFVVNIGDMMERWTNGLWKSTRHRVLHTGGTYRVSVPFFFEPDWDAKVAPLDECVALSHGPKRFDEVVYRNHLLSKLESNFN